MKYKQLKRKEVCSVIEGKANNVRVPMLLHFWVHADEFGDKKQAVLDILDSYPQDVIGIQFETPTIFEGRPDAPEYRWMNIDDPYKNSSTGIDERIAIRDWAQLDDVLAKWPDPHYQGMFSAKPLQEDAYRLGVWWYCLFEMHWQFRGMTNALMDHHTDPDKVHKLYRSLTDFYLVMLERVYNEAGLDGIFFSDDIGQQTGPFFSIETFREFFKPYYKELIDKAHSLGMHFWLHSCGNIELFIPEFIEIGLDVLHPIQKYTMDEKQIAEKYGDDICIWAGFDVQQTLPWGDTDDVRKEVRFMLDTYRGYEGKLIFGAGNGVNGDCPIENLDALFDEAYKYASRNLSHP